MSEQNLATIIISAFVGSASVIILETIKTLYLSPFSKKSDKAEEGKEILKNYSTPLIETCTKLVWRFNEIFVKKRTDFLKTNTLPFVFNKYKRLSTLYRIGSLLGWIRAIKIELNRFPNSNTNELMPVLSAFKKIESELADGSHVEVIQLEKLCSIWGVNINGLNEAEKTRLANKLEVEFYNLAGEGLKTNTEFLKEQEYEVKLKVAIGISNFLTKKISIKNIDEKVIIENLNKFVMAASYREALIYRDWQDALGDHMLEPESYALRRFKIIEFQQFEELLKLEYEWIKVFKTSIDDIDMEIIDENDFRLNQLKKLAIAVANLTLIIASGEQKYLIEDATLEAANQIIELA